MTGKRSFTKTIAKAICLCIGVLVIILAGFGLWMSDKYAVPIMMYHSVHVADDSSGNSVSPENFEWQMRYLHENGYTVISLQKLVDLIRTQAPLDERYVVITFDDGFEDNYTHAFPVLKQYGFPAVVFSSTSTLGQEGWLKWYQIFEMQKEGVTIGSHTVTQAYLPDLEGAALRREIMGSKRALEANLGVPVKYMSYPTGGFSDEIKELVREAGYEAACTTNRGYDRLNRDVYELNRIKFGNKDINAMTMRAKLSGYYNAFRALKAPH